VTSGNAAIFTSGVARWPYTGMEPSYLGYRCWSWTRPPRATIGRLPPRRCWRQQRTLGALLSSDDYGSSVERAGAGQVLWQLESARRVWMLSGSRVVDLGVGRHGCR
jgi:hypothetical protein